MLQIKALFVFLILSAGFPLLAAEDRVQVKLDTSEADSVLAILAKRKQAQPVTDADWNTLFATDPYQRLKKREAAMQRSFSDDDSEHLSSPMSCCNSMTTWPARWRHGSASTCARAA
jgi:hypothetical protein